MMIKIYNLVIHTLLAGHITVNYKVSLGNKTNSD
jgi:hypothetical protein